MSFANTVYIRVDGATAEYSEAVAHDNPRHHLSFSQAAEHPVIHESGTGLQVLQSSRTALIESEQTCSNPEPSRVHFPARCCGTCLRNLVACEQQTHCEQ